VEVNSEAGRVKAGERGGCVRVRHGGWWGAAEAPGRGRGRGIARRAAAVETAWPVMIQCDRVCDDGAKNGEMRRAVGRGELVVWRWRCGGLDGPAEFERGR
jgi:hypothetical protein